MNIIALPTARVEPSQTISVEKWIDGVLLSNKQKLQEGDILIFSSKIVSYFEGGVVELSTVKPKAETVEMASRMSNADPRLIQLALDEADEVISETPWVLLTRKNGIYSANAGVDTSNVPKGFAVVWPKDPFVSARDLQMKLKSPVIIIDSSCQPGRKGTTAVAIGYSGIEGFQELKGVEDLYGNTLRYSALNIVDSLATAANLVMGESSESCPLAIIRDYEYRATEDTKNDEMIISPSDEMFPLK